MPDYQKMYSMLFNKITDVMEELKTVQEKTEEIYVDSNDLPVKIVKPNSQ